MKISIIMPVYNSEKYLADTINTIINQSYQNWELIVIDDCSTDNSYDIVKSLREKDNRIKLYKNEKNLGICGNRNKGLKYASGEYILFCDDDDFFEPNLIKDNVLLLNKYPSLDMIKFGRKLVFVNSSDEIFYEKETKMSVTGLVTDKYQNYFAIRESDVFLNLWNGMYRKSLLEKHHIVFDEKMKYGSEDANFSYAVYLNSQAVYFNPNVYYIHFKRELSSTSRKFNKNKIDSIITTTKNEFLIWDNINFDIINQVEANIALQSVLDNIMLNQVFHPESNFTYLDRKKLFYYVRKELFSKYYLLNHQINKKLWKKNKKHYIISKIINLKCYRLIDWAYMFVANIKNKQWKD